MTKAQPLLTAAEVAEVLQVKVETVYRVTRRGGLAVCRIGRSNRYRPEDLEAFVKSCRMIGGRAGSCQAGAGTEGSDSEETEA